MINNQIKTTVNKGISEATQDANLTVTKLFINEVYPKIESILKLKEKPYQKVGLSNKDLETVDMHIRNFMLGTDILKIKLYSLNGMTIYSSEYSQIGQDKGFSKPLKAATQGKVASQISHRGKFSALEGEVFEKDLVSSYLPIRDKLGAVIGVAEIYTDRTKAIEHSSKSLSKINAYMILFQVILAILIFFSIWNSLIYRSNKE